jgi:hypothetical protein
VVKPHLTARQRVSSFVSTLVCNASARVGA